MVILNNLVNTGQRMEQEKKQILMKDFKHSTLLFIRTILIEK